jgi:ferredoxin
LPGSLAILGRTNPARAKNGPGLIRPPGAIPEPEFLRTCIRYGECLKSCITNTLQPAIFEAGFEGLWTPRHYMRRAGCEQACQICGQVCPYNAIVFQVVEGRKRPFLDASKCNGCGICEKVCPIAGESAIVVSSQGEIRLRRGSYREEARRRTLKFQPKALKDTLEEEPAVPEKKNSLPPGFLP